MDEKLKHLDYLARITQEDAKILTVTDQQYNASWKQRGGVGAFFIMARKWDRLESAVANNKQTPWDILSIAARDARPEGLIDDIRDLRRYLALIEAELRRSTFIMNKLTERDMAALAEFNAKYYHNTTDGSVKQRTFPDKLGSDEPKQEATEGTRLSPVTSDDPGDQEPYVERRKPNNDRRNLCNKVTIDTPARRGSKHDRRSKKP
jgi:hypothetical protein